ncbi:hypothetical protein [Legionella sp. km772]|uniref:hypothetical protein n=1 Tax=Legionella sp. km772 TaxID=2498111 RepID=UPI000F8CB02A|nr:hypothetical protein [Legionella sp. km772]RUR08708.1 hypothetical protein ELY15_10315 [Legionella sp. km772]
MVQKSRILLLLVSLFIIFTSSLFAAAVKKGNAPAIPSMNSITENIDGPTVQTASDGTKIINNQDGSSVQIHPDGSLFVVNSDGSTIQKNADGTEIDNKI